LPGCMSGPSGRAAGRCSERYARCACGMARALKQAGPKASSGGVISSGAPGRRPPWEETACVGEGVRTGLRPAGTCLFFNRKQRRDVVAIECERKRSSCLNHGRHGLCAVVIVRERRLRSNRSPTDVMHEGGGLGDPIESAGVTLEATMELTSELLPRVPPKKIGTGGDGRGTTQVAAVSTNSGAQALAALEFRPPWESNILYIRVA